MSIFKTKLDILHYLSATNTHKKLDDITAFLEHEQGENHTKRKIKEYLFEMSNLEDIKFENKQGRYGGYKLSDSAKNNMIANAVKALNKEDRNAINDAFELAICSASYHYAQELKNARSKFYLQHNLKDEDYEHYVGYGNKQTYSEIVYGLKDAMVNEQKVRLITKYDFEDNEKIDEVVTPLFLIHDSDETFLVLKSSSRDIKYQNIKNIETLIRTDEKAIRVKGEAIDNKFEAHLNKGKTSIKTRKECIVELEVLHQDGWAFYDLWNHECLEVQRTDSTIKLKFFEIYRAAQFLIIIMEYCKVIYIDNELSDFMQQKILTNRAKGEMENV